MAGEIRCIGSSSRSDVAFPLPPALSPGERENGCQRLREAGKPGNVVWLAWQLPLPEGEGWGEGEQAARPSRPLEVTSSPFSGASVSNRRWFSGSFIVDEFLRSRGLWQELHPIKPLGGSRRRRVGAREEELQRAGGRQPAWQIAPGCAQRASPHDLVTVARHRGPVERIAAAADLQALQSEAERRIKPVELAVAVVVVQGDG